jgi:two-component system CheB/CheR fusion protein
VDSGYKIVENIRQSCIFARHDLTADPPFSHMDLISCRNVLIYLGPAIQDRILPTLHYGLKPGGILVLGTAETIGADPIYMRRSTRSGRFSGRKQFHPSWELSFLRAMQFREASPMCTLN